MGFFEFIRSTRSLLTFYDITVECVVVNDSVSERGIPYLSVSGSLLERRRVELSLLFTSLPSLRRLSPRPRPELRSRTFRRTSRSSPAG